MEHVWPTDDGDTHLVSRGLAPTEGHTDYPRPYSTSVTKPSLELEGPDARSMALAVTAVNSIQALRKGAWQPQGPRPCSCSLHAGSVPLAGRSANSSMRLSA